MLRGKIERYRGIAGRALLGELAPSIFRGMILEALSRADVTREIIIGYVEDNKCLWDMLGPEWQERFQKYLLALGNIDWFTDTWLIEALKGEYPAIASLFLGWKKARNWLKRQCDIFHERVLLGE